MFESSTRITLLCKTDYKKLTRVRSQLNGNAQGYGKAYPKLDTAKVIDDHLFPDDIARIGAIVSLKDMGTGSVTRLLLSDNPKKQPTGDDKLQVVSVTSSLGIALLGSRIGDHIKWTLPNGHVRYLRVFELTTQTVAC
ncbi:hypothetical protein DWB84_03605 [Saccharophagus sp. K07]|jgi:transcription elongation GreA/GreB family factor|uniref:GreA/GreB family elongation factor n=1 Tax=Saccharophagus sp. K07 TaxID=2283636 RepID=UPI00165248F1|nr:GreA/GreB family elongation factor [Saccharophagus sp. K07]MBC6904550.1 hypothetical protein [Saccharophagus sp. K07]